MDVVAEHHIEVGRTTTSFYVDASHLRPYSVERGYWYMLPLFLATSGTLSAPAPWNTGYQLLCHHSLSGNQKPLALAHFKASQFEKDGNVVVFNRDARPMPLNFKSDRIQFHLRSLGGDIASLEEGAELLFGLVNNIPTSFKNECAPYVYAAIVLRVLSCFLKRKKE